MPISTISPSNNTQQAILQQSLSGTGTSLLSALNSAIQRSRDDTQIQFNQEQNFLNTRQRDIENDRVERFNTQDREDSATAREQNDIGLKLDNKRKRLNLGELEDNIIFNQNQKNALADAQATPADFRIRQADEERSAIANQVTSTDQAIRDRENLDRLEDANQDPTSRRIRDGIFSDEQRKILEDNNFTPSEIKVFEQKRARENQETAGRSTDEADVEVDNTINLVATGEIDVKTQSNSELNSALNVINASTRQRDPDVIRLRSDIENQIAERRQNTTSSRERNLDQSKIAGLEAELSQLNAVTDPELRDTDRIARITGEIEELQRKNSSATNPVISTSAAQAALQAAGITPEQ